MSFLYPLVLGLSAAYLFADTCYRDRFDRACESTKGELSLDELRGKNKPPALFPLARMYVKHIDKSDVVNL
jgi:hypothetical protein